MRIVTILAGCRAAIAFFDSASVHACAITIRLTFVTDTTVHRFGGNIIIWMFYRKIGVAGDTGIGGVGRCVQFGDIHE